MENYRKLVKLFKRKFPEYNVNVRRLSIRTDHSGDCSYVNGKFLIRVQKNLSEVAAINIFLHEWAHILAWHAVGDDHGIAWGKAYSKVYRIYVKDYLGL